MQTVKAEIVPWALPKEEIPISIKWPKELLFDKISISLPETLKLKELLNVKEHRIIERVVEISQVNLVSTSDTAFVGVIVSTSDIQSELKHADFIKVRFIRNGETIEDIHVVARVFRPLLMVTDFPKKIILTDTEEYQSLPIKLKFVGFGDIKVKIDAILEGKLVSEKQTIVKEIIRRFRLIDLTTSDKSNSNMDQEEKIIIDPDYVRDIANDIERALDDGQVSVMDITEEDLLEIRKWFDDLRKRKEFFLILYKRVSNMMSSIISELLSTNPSNNVKLDNVTKIRAIIKTPAENMQIKIHYSDSVGNEYEPLEFIVELEDKREKRGLAIEVNVTIENIQNEPYTNVAEMAL